MQPPEQYVALFGLLTECSRQFCWGAQVAAEATGFSWNSESSPFEVDVYFMFNLLRAMVGTAGQEQDPDVAEEICRYCGSRAMGLYGPPVLDVGDLPGVIEARMEDYSRVTNAAIDRGEHPRLALLRTLVRYFGASGGRKVEAMPPIVVRDAFVHQRFAILLSDTDLECGLRFGIPLKHVFSATRDVRGLSPPVLRELMVEGVREAEAVLGADRSEREAAVKRAIDEVAHLEGQFEHDLSAAEEAESDEDEETVGWAPPDRPIEEESRNAAAPSDCATEAASAPSQARTPPKAKARTGTVIVWAVLAAGLVIAVVIATTPELPKTGQEPPAIGSAQSPATGREPRPPIPQRPEPQSHRLTRPEAPDPREVAQAPHAPAAPPSLAAPSRAPRTPPQPRRSSRVSAPAAAIRGKVFVADASSTPDFVALDVGRGQGVSPGMRFGVLRRGRRIAVVQVEAATPDFCAARIVERTGRPIQKGDSVRLLTDTE